MGTLPETNIHFWSYLTQFSLQWENFFRQTCRENQNTCFMSNNFFFKSCCLWNNVENIVEPERPYMTIWRMHMACWVPKATHTHTHTHTCMHTQSMWKLLVFPLQEWLHKRASMLQYMYIACLITRNYIPTNLHSCTYECCIETKEYSFPHGLL
jgi:hypothetical protein